MTYALVDDEGLVEVEEREGKKVYSITDEGRAFLEENKSSVEDIFDRLDEMIDRFVRNPMPDVNRAVRDCAVARSKLGERKVLRVRDIIRILLQCAPSVIDCGPTLLLNQMVRKIGGEPFTPISRLEIHVHTSSPPIVEDLVGIG